MCSRVAGVVCCPSMSIAPRLSTDVGLCPPLRASLGGGRRGMGDSLSPESFKSSNLWSLGGGFPSVCVELPPPPPSRLPVGYEVEVCMTGRPMARWR